MMDVKCSRPIIYQEYRHAVPSCCVFQAPKEEAMVTIGSILQEVGNECHFAMGLRVGGGGHAAMNGPHEAYAVLLEEMDEYWDEVKKYNPNKPGRDTRPRQREELIQIAAMAIRAIYDTIDNGKVYDSPKSGSSGSFMVSSR